MSDYIKRVLENDAARMALYEGKPVVELLPQDVTSFTMPSEITNKELAEAHRDLWQRKVDKLPASMPKKVKQAYADRLLLARQIHAKFWEI